MEPVGGPWKSFQSDNVAKPSKSSPAPLIQEWRDFSLHRQKSQHEELGPTSMQDHASTSIPGSITGTPEQFHYQARVSGGDVFRKGFNPLKALSYQHSTNCHGQRSAAADQTTGLPKHWRHHVRHRTGGQDLTEFSTRQPRFQHLHEPSHFSQEVNNDQQCQYTIRQIHTMNHQYHQSNLYVHSHIV